MKSTFKHILISAMAITLLAGASPCSAANLLTNGSFEVDAASTNGNSNTDSELAGTAIYAGAPFGNFSTTGWSNDGRIWHVHEGTESFPDGDYGIILDADGRIITNGKDVLAQGGLSLEAGMTYYLSFTIWGNSALTAPLDVRLTRGYVDITDETSGTGTLVLDDKTTVGNDGVVETVTVEFTPTVTDTDYALQFFADTPDAANGNHIWFDNVSLIVSSVPASTLSGIAVAPDHAGIVIAWDGESGVSYTVDRTTNLVTTTFGAITNGIPGVEPLTVYTDAPPLAPAAMYRVVRE